MMMTPFGEPGFRSVAGIALAMSVATLLFFTGFSLVVACYWVVMTLHWAQAMLTEKYPRCTFL